MTDQRPPAGAGSGSSSKSGAAADPPDPSGDGPISDVNTLDLVDPTVATAIKAACMAAGATAAARLLATVTVTPKVVTKPGVERWPVKTGTDDDVALVGKNLIGGTDFHPGIVPATVEDLIAFPRTPDMQDVKSDNPAFQSKRALPVEIVIWTLQVTVTAMKLEADGDYHLVLQGASGETMIGEVPMPNTTFLGDSPWLDNIQAARQAVDDKFVRNLSPQNFVLSSSGMLVPRAAVSIMPAGTQAAPPAGAPIANLPRTFATPSEGQEQTMFTFKTAVSPTDATITGVGFFDAVHGQMGVSQANGIEIHPILKIVFS